MEERFRKTFTGMLILIWVAMGFYLEIGGPTMFDLRINLASALDDIARCVSAVGIGMLVGAFIAGLCVNVAGEWKFLLVTGAAALASVTVISMAFVTNLTLLWFAFFSLGMSSGITNVAGQRILLELWKEKAASPMHAMHMGFGIGALLAPLVANPFLAVLDFDRTPDNNTEMTSQHGQTEEFVVVEESRVHLAYTTIGILIIVLSSPFFIYPFIKCFRRPRGAPYNNMDTSTQGCRTRCLNLINPATYADGSFAFGLFVFVIIFLYFINLVGSEQLFGNFIRTFSVDELHFERDEASYLDTVYWGFFTIGRFTGSLFAHFVPIRVLFLLDAFLYLLFTTLTNIFAAKSKTSLWVFSALVGFFIGPLFPAAVSYANTQIEVGGVVLTMIVFATGFGQMLYVWIEGELYAAYGPKTILYALQVASAAISVVVVVFVCVGSRRGDRFSRASKGLLNNTYDVSYTNEEPKEETIEEKE